MEKEKSRNQGVKRGRKKIKMTIRLLALFTVISAAVFSSVNVKAWGPDRDTFTTKNPPRHVVFNSIVDNIDEIGNELYFLSASEYTGDGNDNFWTDKLMVQEGKEYVLRFYIRNDCPDVDAEEVRAYMILPTNAGTKLTISAKITAANAEPQTVWDETSLTSKDGRPFTLRYVEGSAKFYTAQKGKIHSFSLDTNTYDLFTSRGFLLGYENLNGIFPGSTSGYLTIHVIPQFSALRKMLLIGAAILLTAAIISLIVYLIVRRKKREKRKYDVFVSYRKVNGFAIGNDIYKTLTGKKINTFFDTHELDNGPFPKQIEEAIKDSWYFVLVLSPNALDRCVNPGDWVREEIRLAWENDLTIIPVLLPDFDMDAVEKNEELPDYVKDVLKQQAVSMRDPEYYEEALVKLRKRVRKRRRRYLLFR